MGVLIALSRWGGGSIPCEYSAAWTRTADVLCKVEYIFLFKSITMWPFPLQFNLYFLLNYYILSTYLLEIISEQDSTM